MILARDGLIASEASHLPFGSHIGPRTSGVGALTDLQERMINLIRREPSVTIARLGDDLGVTSERVKIALNKLKRVDLLKREGGRKKGIWVLRST